MTSPSRLVLLSALLLAAAALAVAASSGAPPAPLQRRLFSMPQAGDVPAVNVAEPVTIADALSSTSADAAAAAPTADAASYPYGGAGYGGGASYGPPRTGCPFSYDIVQRGPHSGDTVYTAASADQKLAYLFSFLRTNQSTANFVPASSGLVFTESLEPTVHHRSDFVPLERRKAVHGGGVVARCELRMADYAGAARRAYTGVLAPGKRSQNIIMRFSSVVDPVDIGLVPSFALKFLRDGRDSVNHVALNSQAPQTETTNPFARAFTNQFVGLPPAIQVKFGEVTQFPNFTGNSQIAYPDNPDSEPTNFPWQLIWVPDAQLQAALPVQWPFATSQEYYTQMLPPQLNIRKGGQRSHALWAVDAPGGQAFYVGDLYLMTDFIRSDFGDRTLFFKHTITEEDMHYRPEFAAVCPFQNSGCSPCPQTYDCFSSSFLPDLQRDTAAAQAAALNISTVAPASTDAPVAADPDVTAAAAAAAAASADLATRTYLRYYLDPEWRASTTHADARFTERFDTGKANAASVAVAAAAEAAGVAAAEAAAEAAALSN